jgi:hypothetical protein
MFAAHLALSLALCSAPVPVKKPALELTAQLDKVTYKPGDKVTLAFTLKNVSGAELWIGDGYPAPENHEVGPGRHFELAIADATGTRLHFWNHHLTECRTSGIRKVFKLKPGDTYTGNVILTEGGYATVKTDKRHLLGSDSAEYKFKLVYQVNPKSHGVWQPPKDFDPENLWHGIVTSNPLTLTFK